MVAAAAIGAAVVGGMATTAASNKQASATRAASAAQTASGDVAVAEQRRQFDAMRELFAPFVEGGNTAFTAQQNLIGLGGEEAQQNAISAIQQGSEYREMVRSGENAILQNASATGGLRGGNTQASLAQFRPQALNDLINQQYSRLGGISQLGQAAAAGQAAQGSAISTNISNLQQSQGAAQAAALLQQGQIQANALNQYGQLASTAVGTIAANEGF